MLKQRSYVFKAKPSGDSHGHFLTAKEGSFLLDSVTSSIEGYINVIAPKSMKRNLRVDAVVKI